MKNLFLLLCLTIFSQMLQAQLIVDFSTNPSLKNWQVVNDDVMGGISQSKLSLTEANLGLFEGKVSLENYGGFCSIRYNFQALSTQGKTVLKIKLKGDGKKYQLRIKADRNDFASYIQEFKTTGAWQEVHIVLAEMYPSFRGRRLNRPNFEAPSMQQLAILIGNKRAERFALEIESIELQ